MQEIIFQNKLNDSEIKRFCDNHNYTLILCSYKENKTILKVI